MALASLLFANNVSTEFRTGGTKDAFLIFDAVIKESHNIGATITDREIEDGSKISDHLAANPNTVTVVGLISENPLNLISTAASASLGLATQGAAAAGTVAAGVVGGAIMGFVNGNRTQNAFKILQELHAKNVVFDFVTGLQSYKNMMLESVVADKNQALSNDAQFTATLKKATIVSSQLISFNEADINSAASGASSQDLGKQSTKAASESTGNNGSILFNAFGNYFS